MNAIIVLGIIAAVVIYFIHRFTRIDHKQEAKEEASVKADIVENVTVKTKASYQGLDIDTNGKIVRNTQFTVAHNLY
jgi:undecaprenyl pyrophosphate phosphatase UppP